jgi:hypothetical protein
VAKSTAERQAEYRARLVARASLFDAADGARKRALLDIYEKAGAACCTEEEHARQYFLNNPYCGAYPSVGFENGTLGVCFGPYADYEYEIAAFVIAVRRVSSIPLLVNYFGDGSGGALDDVASIPRSILGDLIDAEKILRKAGLWGA